MQTGEKTELLTLYSDVRPSPVSWLWYPYIAVGKITLLQGDPGDGKSTMMLNLIAELSRGGATPDGRVFGRPQRVIYQCSEDGAEDTIKPALVFYLADPIIIVPVKPTEDAANKGKSIVTKETLPEDTIEIPSDEYAEDGNIEKNQAKSRAIYFDDFVAKQETEFHVADLGDEKYSPECIKRLLQKNSAPAEGWIYLKGMAKLTKFGFTIFPEDWEAYFGPSIYERESVKVDHRFEMSTEPQGGAIPYGWTVGLELPTQETVDGAIAELKAEMAC